MPIEACDSPGFAAVPQELIEGKPGVHLYKEHPYFSQVRVKWELVNNPVMILLYTLPQELKYNELSLTKYFGIKSYYPS